MGGRAFVDEDGNVVNGKSLDMVVEGQNVYIVSYVCYFCKCMIRRGCF